MAKTWVGILTKWNEYGRFQAFKHFWEFFCMVLILRSTLNLKIWWFFFEPLCVSMILIVWLVLWARPYYFVTRQIEEGFPLRVNRPITDHLPMTEHFNRFFSILSDVKWYRRALTSSTHHSTHHLWTAKSKDQPKKSSKEDTLFWIAKHVFFIFLHFDPSHFQTSYLSYSFQMI
jgi:hypothetical protein